MVMRRHVAEENAKRAPPTVHWSIAHLPQRQLAHPWPFPVSAVDGGLVRNVQPEAAPKKQAKGRKRMDWCRGWAGNAARVAQGLKPTGHVWPYTQRTNTMRCHMCKREWAELWATGRTA